MKQPELKANERELIKLIHYFSKRAQRLMEEGELSQEHTQLTSACQNLETQLLTHAANRTAILEKRERLQQIIEDNAQCPKCGKADMLKKNGTTTNEYGWRCNTYRCRRCNTTFTWNRPNNPWDMVKFMQRYIQELTASLPAMEALEDQSIKAHTVDAIMQLNDSMARLQPVLENSDEEVTALEDKEREMDKMIHQFKTYLQIEKIKLDAAYDEPDAD
jgi:chromosome condensin MukBEF ATPase and DNA-binding subunit MukB